MVRVRVRLGYTMAICLVLAPPSKPQANGLACKVSLAYTLLKQRSWTDMKPLLYLLHRLARKVNALVSINSILKC